MKGTSQFFPERRNILIHWEAEGKLGELIQLFQTVYSKSTVFNVFNAKKERFIRFQLSYQNFPFLFFSIFFIFSRATAFLAAR